MLLLTLTLILTLMLTLTLTLSINLNTNPNPMPVRRSGPHVRSLHFTTGLGPNNVVNPIIIDF